MLNNNQRVFYELIQAGLWDTDFRLISYEPVDFKEVYRLAEEQSVVGLITAGLEHIQDIKPPQSILLPFIGHSLQLEQRNKAMNAFVSEMIEGLRKKDICVLLVKGQGVAQCYERPLWRSCGDVDLFLSEDNYEKAKEYLIPLAVSVEPEADFKKHLGLNIEGWLVELHGCLRSGLSHRIDKVLDCIQAESFHNGNIRSTYIDNTQVFLLSVENDIVYVFSHILDHFYKGGIGIRQICDWCRLLWSYRIKLDKGELESLVKRMGLMSEWKAFSAFAVEYLGMPAEAMPFYDNSGKWKNKADRISTFVLEVGNFGHNRDNSFYKDKSFIVRKVMAFKQRMTDVLNHARLFPLDSMRFSFGIILIGFKAFFKGDNSHD